MLMDAMDAMGAMGAMNMGAMHDVKGAAAGEPGIFPGRNM